ncbi:RNA polymerase sigma-70 factor [Parabacteroides sp. OttesenSCG-928-K15]|nr:RNA polymerase sigma-70 factor [Parabacteroides sp. OttesenSCG-928-K15]
MQIVYNKDQEKKFSEIYAVYFPKLLRFATFYVVSKDDAENIVQDIFAHLWERIDLFEAIKNPDTFLFTLIKNRCIDFLRHQVTEATRKEKIQEIAGKEFAFKLYSLQQFDETQVSVTEIQTLLNAAIDKLPERCREVFLLSRKEGLKNREIAEKMNINIKTVEAQMTIALHKLKTELKDFLPILLFFI